MKRSILAAILLIGAGPAHAETFSNGILEIQSDSEVIRLNIEIADDADERSRGLMFRKSLDDDAGMLFIYPEPRIASFWMKNTLIPLDMLFIDADGKIESIATKTTPFSLKAVRSGAPVLTVLEIDGGDAERLGIDVGDTVKWTEIQDEK